MNTKKLEISESDINTIKTDIAVIKTILEEGRFATTEKLHIEIDKVKTRINNTVVGLTLICVTLGGAVAWFLKNGI